MLWNSTLSVGNKKIDDQHKELLKKLDTVIEAFIRKKGDDVVEETLNFLTDYVVKHLKDEELLQKQQKYPKFNEHKKAHESFIKELNKIKAEFDKKGATISVKTALTVRLVKMLRDHITKEDKLLADYIKNFGK